MHGQNITFGDDWRPTCIRMRSLMICFSIARWSPPPLRLDILQIMREVHTKHAETKQEPQPLHVNGSPPSSVWWTPSKHEQLIEKYLWGLMFIARDQNRAFETPFPCIYKYLFISIKKWFQSDKANWLVLFLSFRLIDCFPSLFSLPVKLESKLSFAPLTTVSQQMFLSLIWWGKHLLSL